MGGLKSQNKLTILYNSRKDDRRKQYVMCLCECGNIKELRLDHIKSGRIKSCGCLGKTQLLSHGCQGLGCIEYIFV